MKNLLSWIWPEKPPPMIRTRVCWLSLEPSAWKPWAWTDLYPTGTILLVTYRARSPDFRSGLVQVIGKRQPGGPVSCPIQLSESAFVRLDALNSGSIEVTVEVMQP